MSEAGEERAYRGQGGNSCVVSVGGSKTEEVARFTPVVRPAARCNRCNFPVHSKPWGCKNPCANCGTVYPLGDCSD